MEVSNNYAERVASLEVELRVIKDENHAHNLRFDSYASKLDETNKKLDELLELKNKGMGAVWLASILIAGVYGVAHFFSKVWP